MLAMSSSIGMSVVEASGVSRTERRGVWREIFGEGAGWVMNWGLI